MVVSLENDSKLFAIIKEAYSGVGENFYDGDRYKRLKQGFKATLFGLLQNCHNGKSAIHLFLKKNGSAYVRDVCSLD